MSLATASAGGAGMGGGGLSTAAMAHGGPSGMTLHRAAAQGPPGGAHAHFAGPGVSAPGNVAALGADLVDKSQRGLGLRSVRNVATLPLVAVDLYGEGGEVAYFPPVPQRHEDEEEENPAEEEEAGPLEVHAMGKASGAGTDLVIKTDDDAAHKAVRRMLTKGAGYEKVFSDALIDGAAKKGAATIVKPHLLLGARRTSLVHPSALEKYTVSPETDSAAIAEDTARSSSVSVRNSTLDGSGAPNGDDYDRVSFYLSLHKSKKSLAMLPEEAVGIVLAQSKKLVDSSWSADTRSASDVGKDDEEAYLELPAAIAVPGWANLDSAAEALLDAAGSSAALYQRSVAACAGALLPSSASGGQHRLLQLLGKRMNEERKVRSQREASGAEDDGPTDEFLPTIVLAGMTSDGIELTTVQLGRMQNMAEADGLAPFGDLTVHTTVCYQSSDPLSSVKRAMKELVEETDALLPELFDDDGGPVAIVTYGAVTHQLKLKEKLDGILKTYKSKGVRGWGENSIPFLSTREECIACGTALLAGISHGRVYTIESGTGGKSSKKHRARPGVSVNNASCSAVGVRYNYFDGKKDKWGPVKAIFDFDRRVPAGPYQIDLSAAEAAALREAGGFELGEEKLLEETKHLGGAKNIPKREEAALAMRLQVVQRTQRGGEWIPVGDSMRPLTMMKGGEDDGDDDGGKSKKKETVACESSVLELSLNPVGLITSSLVSDGQSVVQATKSARNSALRYYLGIAAAILFFGGFLVKSYVEEHVFERDTKRLLAYYKRAAPNSLHDGDLQGARYLVWKYKGKKAKLWRRLEAKYGVPVKHEWEWDDGLDDPRTEEEEEQDLDDEDAEKDDGKGKEEPDL